MALKHSHLILLIVVAAGQIPTETISHVPTDVCSTDVTQVPGISSLSRQARRLYLGNIPFGMTDVSVCCNVSLLPSHGLLHVF